MFGSSIHGLVECLHGEESKLLCRTKSRVKKADPRAKDKRTRTQAARGNKGLEQLQGGAQRLEGGHEISKS